MQKHPLLSVKQAAEMLRLEERSVRERLINGQLKGEKKSIGLREKWFVYSGAVEAALSKDQGRTLEEPLSAESPEQEDSPVVQTTTIDPQMQILIARVQELEEALKKTGMEVVVPTEVEVESSIVEESDVSIATIDDEQSLKSTSSEDPRNTVSSVADALWDNLICKYQEKLEEKDQAIGEIRAELAEKDRQLKLLPDFEKQKADLLKKLDAERTAAEIQFERAKEKEEEAKSLEAENERLKQKAEEAALSLEKLQLIEKEMQLLKRPWWKKFFLPAPQEIDE